ncbi:MAG: NAD-dependent epimerase/dehydratase family protein [Phycisphaerae bacterium]
MSDFSGRRFALVGGAGFIGHHLALRLKSLGAEVLVVDSLAVNNLYSLHREGRANANAELYLRVIRERLDLLEDHGIPLEVMDARDYNGLSHVLASFDPDAVVHLAAVAHAGKSNKDPFSTFDHSLRTLENALDISRAAKLHVRHFVYLSSSMVYGHFKTLAVDENTVCEPLGIYGALKFAGEKIVIAYNQVFNLPYTIIRPSALYGERCISRRVSQIFMENAAQGLPITVNGDGSDRLDFTYIGDLVSGLVNVLENKNALNQTFNLTYGQSRSIAELAKIVAEHFPGIKVEYKPKDSLMPDRGTLCVNKAKQLIGYQPWYSLELGMAEYARWYKELFAPACAA